MARIRTVKPELFTHEELYDAERDTGLPLRLAFVGLFTVADREGRFRWHPRELKLSVMPYDDGINFADVLCALCATGFVVRYEIAGEHYGYIPTFKKHQNANSREAQSRLPDPAQCTVVACEVPCNCSAVHLPMQVHAHANASEVESRKAPPDKAFEEKHGNYSAMHGNYNGEGEGELLLKPKTIGKEETGSVAPPASASARIDDDDAKDKLHERRTVAIAVRLRRAGIMGANASNPHICEWAGNPRVTDDLLDAAADMAKKRTTRPGPNYLAPIIAELLNPPPARPPNARSSNVHDDRKRAYDVLTGKTAGEPAKPDPKTIDGARHVKRIG